MAYNTDNLGLFCYDTDIDSGNVFSIDQALNDNWAKIDTKVKQIQDSIPDIPSGGYVKKSGDTMTGNLQLTKEGGSFVVRTMDRELSDSLTSTKALTFSVNDKNNTQMGAFFHIQNNSGYRYVCMQARKHDASGWMGIRVGYTPEHKAYTYAPACALTNSIVTTTGLEKATNGYVKFGNGIIIQWGYLAANTTTYHGGRTINLPTGFSNKNYQLAFGLCTKDGGGGIDFQDVGFASKTTTSFNIRMECTDYVAGCSWMAMGY